MKLQIVLFAVSLAVLCAVSHGSPPSNRNPSHRAAQEPDRKLGRPAQPDNKRHQNSDPWQVCFYTNWAQYRAAPGTFFPEDIDATLCSHIFFAFANMDGNSLVPYEPNDVEMYGRLNALKEEHTSLKTSLAVGGWTFGTAKMTLMMSSQDNRTEFINSVINVLRTFNFDGVDIDFEYPASRGSPLIDKAQFTCLLEEMRAAFNAENPLNPLLLSAGVAAGMANVQPGYDIARICDVLDKVNLMSYDFFGMWDETANPHGPLFDRVGQSTVDSQKCVAYAADYWADRGCPRHKINIGVSSYGRAFKLLIPGQGGMGAPITGPADQGRFTLTPGILNYYEMCDSFFQTATITVHPEHMVPWANTTTEWVGYDDPSSVVTKANWIKANNYGGFMFWSLDHDDFNGLFCAQGRYPILNALHGAFEGYVVPDDPVSPPSPTPDPNMNYCADNSLEDGDYPDPYTCTRCYQCAQGSTQIATCDPGEIMLPHDVPTCRPIELVSEEDICLDCYEFCSCETLVTPLSHKED